MHRFAGAVDVPVAVHECFKPAWMVAAAFHVVAAGLYFGVVQQQVVEILFGPRREQGEFESAALDFQILEPGHARRVRFARQKRLVIGADEAHVHATQRFGGLE